MENFFGGVTTAHGINRVFDEDNGILRRLFWFGAFTASFYALFFFVIDSIMLFIEAKSDTSFGQDSHAGRIVPPVLMTSIAFEAAIAYIQTIADSAYDDCLQLEPDSMWMLWLLRPEFGKQPAAFSHATLSFTRKLCINALQQKHDESNSDANYNADSSSTATMEDSKKYVDVILTAQSMTNFSEKLGCGLDGYTDTCWWGPPKIDENYGACHTFNPYEYVLTENNVTRSCSCQGFPVGDGCTSDADCEHMYDKSLKGGICDPTKKYVDQIRQMKYLSQTTIEVHVKSINFASQEHANAPCANQGKTARLQSSSIQVCYNSLYSHSLISSCRKRKWNSNGVERGDRSGQDCRLMTSPCHLIPPNSFCMCLASDATLTAASKARWNAGAIVHFHSHYDDGNLGEAYTVPPGKVTNFGIARENFKEQLYPFTNCSKWYNVDPSAVRCCKRDVSDVTKGELPVINVSSGGALVNLTNPMLSCNILDPE
eukprot:753432-Hanusia_phi.AAC.2